MSFEFTHAHYLASIKPGDNGMDYNRPDTFEYYKQKYDMCKEVNPKSILEIGVRYGYSAYAFLSAALGAEKKVHYTGIDMQGDSHGGAGVPTFSYVDELFKKLQGWESSPDEGITWKFWSENTQNLNVLDQSYDFMHVDGDHTFNGAFHDLELCFSTAKSGAVILVDDYTHIGDVGHAVNTFVKIYSHKIAKTDRRASIRGEYLITVK